MTLVVDTREPTDLYGMVKAAGKSRGIDVSYEALGAGDYLAGAYLIERKTYSDFIGRLTQTENSIWTQVRQLKAAADEESLTPVLLLEGEWEAWSLRALPEEAVSGAFGAIIRMGVMTQHLPSDVDTAAFVCKLAESTSSGGTDASAIRDAPSVPEDKRPRFLVEGLPSVGPVTAKALLSEFGTPRRVFNASEDELTSVEGIGEKTAEKIDAALSS